LTFEVPPVILAAGCFSKKRRYPSHNMEKEVFVS
jgi:hypothetical protein